MKLTSTAFENGEKIPSKYTCDGENISPPLEIKDIPERTMTLVLLMDDPDIPDFVKQKFNIEKWDHWTVFNIPVDTTTISEAQNPPGILGVNTGKKNSYGGPCPPDKEHRYFFKLFALDTELNLAEGATQAQVMQAIEGHIIAQTQLMGKYERQKN